MRQTLSVDGESLDDLLAMLPYFELTNTGTGWVNIRTDSVPKDIAIPFLRALMRREARLLRDDADGPPDSIVDVRTQTQRRADAFVELVEGITSAARYRRR